MLQDFIWFFLILITSDLEAIFHFYKDIGGFRRLRNIFYDFQSIDKKKLESSGMRYLMVINCQGLLLSGNAGDVHWCVDNQVVLRIKLSLVTFKTWILTPIW